MENVSSKEDIDSQTLLIVNILLSILLMNFNSKSIYIVQFAQIQKHQDSQNNYQIGLYIAGFYLGIIILKLLNKRKTSLFVNFLIGYTFYFIGQLFIYFLSSSTVSQQSQNNELILFITLSKLCLGISNIICLIETIQLLQKSKNEDFKRVIFLVLPLLQIVSFICTSVIPNYWFIFIIVTIQILLTFFLYYKEKYITNKQQQFTKNEQIIEETIQEDNEQNSTKQILKREVKFMKILIFLIIQITQDITFMVGSDILMLGFYINLLHIFFYKRMNIKITLITGQFVVIIAIILSFVSLNLITNIIIIIGYFIGIGSTQYYIIQKQLLSIQIIDYFETYSIFQLIQICIFDSYISNLIKFYITSSGYKLLIIIMTTTLLLLVIKKRKQQPIKDKNNVETKNEIVNNNEIEVENEQNSQS